MSESAAFEVVQHTAGEGGLAKVIVHARDGAVAEVYLLGAQVTSWKPAPGGEERLFLSQHAEFREGTAIRGGIPVIFPQFAEEGPLPRHGFARTSTWAFASAQEESDGAVVASFQLNDSPATRAIWPMGFRAVIAVRIGGARLTVKLSVENTGATPFDFTAALHSYLRVDEARHAEVLGLQNGRYRTAPHEILFDDDDRVRIDGAIDRVYIGAPTHVTLREPGRQLSVERTKFPDIVIWNPGAEAAARMKDMEQGGENRMLCVEAAVVQTPVSLMPGRSWWGSQSFVAYPRAT